MTELSPVAQAIMDAYMDEDRAGRLAVAAALRALAKQSTFADTRVGVTEEVVLVDDILKIATELEQI